jgi:hypothetical protein
VLCVCYKTLTAATHSICWDISNQKIFDSDCSNEDIFSYEMWENKSPSCENIMKALHTTMNTQCILYVGFWTERSTSKQNKRRKKRIFDEMS